MNFRPTPWRHDPLSKNFSHDALFGTLDPKTLPRSLNRPRGPILDQGPTLRCTGYGSAANGFYIHGQKMNPDWSAAKIGRKQGRSVDDNGGDPNATIKHMRDDGFLPATVSDRNWKQEGIRETGMSQWDNRYDSIALNFDNISGFVKVDNRAQDYFDSIKSALYLAYDPVQKLGPAVDSFQSWYSRFNLDTPQIGGTLSGWHRQIFTDFDRTHKTEYIIGQNSYGKDFGDGGFQYWERDVINAIFAERGTTLKILKTLTPEQIERAKEIGIWGDIQRRIIFFWEWLSDLSV